MGELHIRQAQPGDLPVLSSYLNFQPRIHRHLDWKSPLDWLGAQPYLLAYHDSRLEAVLACPPDPPHVAWVRLFACAPDIPIANAWIPLLDEAVSMLSGSTGISLEALALHQWFEGLLIKSGFEIRQRIVVLEWEGQLPPPQALPPDLFIRPMQKEDLPEVAEVDAGAFESIWQNSLGALQLAFAQSSHCTVAVWDGRVIGYQISTSFPFSGHLARLAVRPEYQRMRIAYGLVHDLLARFKQQGIWRTTVNTQDTNLASISLYEKTGFRRTGEEFAVYEIPLNHPR
jgi:ribosomal-protein-alanine N-acetyltransferase